MIAIVDCNSFYASCERLFRPELRNKPIVVLSNNDGCIIARTDEAKEAGVKMGAVFHQVKRQLDEKEVYYFSSNYQLYGDMSERVMRCLQNLNPDIEVYSIDEAFLDLAHVRLPKGGLLEYGKMVKQTVLKQTGIPISIGIGPTKVLAKVANRLAKKNKQASQGVMVLANEGEIIQALKQTPLADVWGFGYRKASKFKTLFGLSTAYDCYAIMTETVMRKQFGGVVGLRVLRELRGVKSIEVSAGDSIKKHIASTRSFGKPIDNFSDLSEAISTYTERAFQKLLNQQTSCKLVGVYIRSNPFQKQNGYYSNSAWGALPHSSTNVYEVIEKAKQLLGDIYKPALTYVKAGIFLSSFEDLHINQLSLFGESASCGQTSGRASNLSNAISSANNKYGTSIIKTASSGIEPDWQMRMSFRSPQYTTNWQEIPVVTLG